MSADGEQWGPLLLSLSLLVGMWIGWACSRRPLKLADEDAASLRRYRQAVEDVDRWCGHQYPQVRLVAEHIHAVGEGTALNSGTPAGMEPCTPSGLRQQLARLARHHG